MSTSMARWRSEMPSTGNGCRRRRRYRWWWGLRGSCQLPAASCQFLISAVYLCGGTVVTLTWVWGFCKTCVFLGRALLNKSPPVQVYGTAPQSGVGAAGVAGLLAVAPALGSASGTQVRFAPGFAGVGVCAGSAVSGDLGLGRSARHEGRDGRLLHQQAHGAPGGK